VFAPVCADGRGRKGAGYLLGDGLVLTARHVITGAIGPCDVRPLGRTGWTTTSVLWPGDEDGDGALLRVDGPVGDVDRIGLGRLVGNDRPACEAIGFPWAQLERRGGGSVRKSEHLVGEVDRFSGQEPGVASWSLTIHARGSVPKSRTDGGSPWEGMSGAGLVCSGLLVGVVTIDPARFDADRLRAVPLTRLVALPAFAEALHDARGDTVVLDAVEAQGVLERAHDPPPPRRARQASSFLLGARYGVVPFRPRPELERLRDWAHSSQDIDIAVLTGAAGVGKTRLARELCRQLARVGWVAGSLAFRPDSEQLPRLAAADEAVLVVIDDYAETRRGDVLGLLERLTRRPTIQRPRRLLLAARQLGDWWTELQNECADTEARDLLHYAPRIDVAAIEETAEDRVAVYREALAAYAPHTGSPRTDATVPNLADQLFETVLFVHMAALRANDLVCAGVGGVM